MVREGDILTTDDTAEPDRDVRAPLGAALAAPSVRRYRKKPVEVEAIEWTGENFNAVRAFTRGALGLGQVGDALPLWVTKSQAVCYVQRGDWVIREPDGSGFYPCSEADFPATYEPAAPAAVADDIRPREGEPGWYEVTCGCCGTEFGTNFSVGEFECPGCEARRCPHCATWFGEWR